MSAILDQQRPEEGAGGGRPNVLLLAISYPDVERQMAEHGFDEDILDEKRPSVDQAVECCRRGILTEMDARDLARCVSTEEVCNVNVYSASKENGAVYRPDRHTYGDFNTRNFCQNLKASFGEDIQFSQVILDYYWMPTGWLVTRWAKTLFQRTLPDLVRHKLLSYPSKRSQRRQNFEEGVVFLPFCAHVCKELVGAIDILEEYYAIDFVTKDGLTNHSLWKGTMEIDGDVMQTRLGKRLDQEEVYCTFRPKDIYATIEDAHVSKPEVMRVLLAIEDYDNTRMIRLRPLRQHEPPSPWRDKFIKPEVGGFIGLNYEQADRLMKKQPRQSQKQVATTNKERPPHKKKQDIKQKLAKQNQLKRKRALQEAKRRKKLAKKKAKEERRKKKKARKQQQQKKKAKSGAVEEVSEEEESTSNDSSSESESSDSSGGSELVIPDMTYFFPGPVVDLNTYMAPEECAVEDAESVRVERKREKKRQKIQALNAATRRRFQDLGSLKSDGPQYLSFNPRRVPDKPEPSADLGQGAYVEDISEYVKKDGDNKFRDVDMEGACDLFNLRQPKSVEGVSRTLVDRQRLACYKIPKAAFVDALQNGKRIPPVATDQTDQNDYDMFPETPVFHKALGAYRNDWTVVFDTKTQMEIEKQKKRLRNFKNSVFDRSILFDTVLRWLTFEREPSLDPSGELSRIYEYLQDREKLLGLDLVQQARHIESKWFMLSKGPKRQVMTARKVAPSAGANESTECTATPNPVVAKEGGEKVGFLSAEVEVEAEANSTAAATNDHAELVTTESTESNGSYDRAVEYLIAKDGPTPSEYDSEFKKIDYLVAEGDRQSLNDRAKELGFAYDLACNMEEAKSSPASESEKESPQIQKDLPLPRKQVETTNDRPVGRSYPIPVTVEKCPASPKIPPPAISLGLNAAPSLDEATYGPDFPLNMEQGAKSPSTSVCGKESLVTLKDPPLPVEKAGSADGNGRKSHPDLKSPPPVIAEDTQFAGGGVLGSTATDGVSATVQVAGQAEQTERADARNPTSTEKVFAPAQAAGGFVQTERFDQDMVDAVHTDVVTADRKGNKSHGLYHSAAESSVQHTPPASPHRTMAAPKKHSQKEVSPKSRRAYMHQGLGALAAAAAGISNVTKESKRKRKKSKSLSTEVQKSRLSTLGEGMNQKGSRKRVRRSGKNRPVSARSSAKVGKPQTSKNITMTPTRDVPTSNIPLPPRPPFPVDERLLSLMSITDLTIPDFLAFLKEYISNCGGERARRFGLIFLGLAERKFDLEISQGVDRLLRVLTLPHAMSHQAVQIETYYHLLNMRHGLDWAYRIPVDKFLDFLSEVTANVNLESRRVPSQFPRYQPQSPSSPSSPILSTLESGLLPSTSRFAMSHAQPPPSPIHNPYTASLEYMRRAPQLVTGQRLQWPTFESLAQTHSY